jgi:3-isopropylmalate/(R)-2-methylmalate dehydratase small subunit
VVLNYDVVTKRNSFFKIVFEATFILFLIISLISFIVRTFVDSFSGRVWRFGDDIDTDLIIAARYLNTSDPKELAKHVMQDAREDFAELLQKGDIIVAGDNFGCGSSREHAPIALKEAGVSVIVAKSFARIFYRNAFNVGLTILEVDEADEIKEGDMLQIDIKKGSVENKDSSKTYNFGKIPDFMKELLEDGGLMNYAKNRLVK